MGVEDGRYKVIVGFDPIHPTLNKNAGGDELIVLLEIDGDEFEIVGHEVSADERPEQAAAQATDPAEPSGEFSGN